MKYFEFPLTIPVFTGGEAKSQGPDRVVAIAPNPGQGHLRGFYFCLAMTHRGGDHETDPRFFPCESASMDECRSPTANFARGWGVNYTMRN